MLRFFIAGLLSFLVPTFAFADALNGPIVPNCSGVGAANDVACNFCDLIHLFNNGLNFAVAFTVVVATIMFVYAGYLYFSASSNPEHIKKAHGIFSKVFIGLVIVIAAWLIIDVVMKTLVGNSQLGPWNEINCTGIASPAGTIAAPQQPGAPQPVTAVPPTGPLPARACAAAMAYEGTSTAVPGTECGPGSRYNYPGGCACAYSVNQVLTNAGIGNLDQAWVPSLESALQSGRGVPISASQAQCGDIIVRGDQHHVGFCLNTGCTRTISNSSANSNFNGNNPLSYWGSGARIYRIIR